MDRGSILSYAEEVIKRNDQKGVKAALVGEAFDQTEALTQVAENPFLDIELDIVVDDV